MAQVRRYGQFVLGGGVGRAHRVFLGFQRIDDGFVVHARLDRIVDHDGRLPATVGYGLGLGHRGRVAQA